MVTMDMLEQDNYIHTTIQHQQRPFRFLLHHPDVFFCFCFDEVASSKVNLHGGFFRK